MNELTIRDYRVVGNGNEKPYCVYVIDACINGHKYIVEKRYSQFYTLHGELRKQYSTPYFPPKKVRSLQPKVLEKRRQALEVYLQMMLKLNQSRTQVLSFLGISRSDCDSSELNGHKSNEERMNRQPVFQFRRNFIPEGARKSNVPDIVTEGVLLGFYKSL